MPSKTISPLENAKRTAGYAAADYVQDGMLVGLGTGSTAFYFIDRLIQRCKEGLQMRGVATSQKSLEQALAGNIPMADISNITSIDLTVDGADEIDPHKRMIKGGGGALLREKILATMSRNVVIIIDETKQVQQLGKFPLPVEIIPFGYNSTIARLKQMGYPGVLRKDKSGNIYITDNGNYIVDIHFTNPLDYPENDNLRIRFTPGVVETGFFFNLVGTVITGFKDGRVEIRS